MIDRAHLGRILHAEQQFTYFAPICAGDTITVESKFTDIYDRMGNDGSA